MGNCIGCISDNDESGATYTFLHYNTNSYEHDDYLEKSYKGLQEFIIQNGRPIIVENNTYTFRNREEQLFIDKYKHTISYRLVYPTFTAFATSLLVKRLGSQEYHYIFEIIEYNPLED